MKTPTLEELIKERDALLQENPELQDFQNGLDEIVANMGGDNVHKAAVLTQISLDKLVKEFSSLFEDK